MESAGVGLILDTSVPVTAERRNRTVPEILEQFRAAHWKIEIGLPAVTVVELAHAIERAIDLNGGRPANHFSMR